MNNQLAHFLHPGYFIDSDNQSVKAFANKITSDLKTPKEKAVKLYYEVRDMMRYSPYGISLVPKDYKASEIISRKNQVGHCIDKAIVLCALGRAVGIPTRLHFSNVRNHIATEKLEEYLGTDIMVFHGFTEFYLNDKWVKCTPAFNLELCQKLNVAPLEFDGENDSIFQEYDREGADFMEYLYDYGVFHDFPLDLFEKEIRKHYAKVFEKMEVTSKVSS